MFDFALRNFRSFHDPGIAQIRPLTVIVGENSTGKSSFLAILKIALEMVWGDLKPNFNRDPFFLGAYDQIAHYRGGRGGRSPSFGFSLTTATTELRRRNVQHPFRASFSVEFVKAVSQPQIRHVRVCCGEYKLNIEGVERTSPKIFLSFPSWKGELPQSIAGLSIHPFSELDFRAFFMFLAARLRGASPETEVPEIPSDELNTFSRMWAAASDGFGPPPLAMAPVRTKPERTYNPVEERRTAEGSHVPMAMARTFFTDHEKWRALQSSLNRFGKSSGLFDEIGLKALGRSPSDPFQIMIKMTGPRSNLIDVGYGVSQVLPIVVDLISSERPHNYLLQQPEVHLHPRGQAELATFLATIIKETKNWIVVETHSDYIIDRLRSDVRKNKHLTCDMISILFFEKQGIGTKIHQIGIDEEGNLQNVPDTYRQFTMDEERRLLGIDDEDAARIC